MNHFRIASVLMGLCALAAFSAPRAASPQEGSSFTTFESGPVRPLALSPDGQTLFACNIPDNRLEVFAVTNHGLRHRGSVVVGLEPVAVAARTNSEVWVVNHLSDSVSIVQVKAYDRDADDRHTIAGRVVRTLLVGDEPRDIVVAGTGRSRVFVTTAHRGQNVPYDPQLTTPGIGRADVWVFDAGNLGDTLTGTPLSILTLFTDTPRALAASPDGTRVYAAGFHTGNQTTTIFEDVVRVNGGLPPPTFDFPLPTGGTVRLPVNFQFIPQPPTGLIVKFRDGKWQDELGRDWSAFVKFNLPDRDVFAIDATANPPTEVASYAHVGTILFNMLVNPANGKLYVSNLDAVNENRFEGAGVFAGHTVRGHLAESRITVIEGGSVASRHLNKHINFNGPFPPVNNPVNAKSLAFPLDMAVTADGSTLYVAAFGSSKIGVFNTAALENDTFVPNVANQIEVSGGGPCGLALDEARGKLYVLTRFDNSIKVVDLGEGREKKKHKLNNPEPRNVVNGRRFLYDASFSSSRGDTACASCHIFGDFDSLAWDLGDPDGTQIDNNGIFTVPPEPFNISRHFRPMKGPMTTQSLRGLANHGAMHWRGDRLNNSEPSVQPNGGAFDEVTAFNKFNVAFVGLNGRDVQIPARDMQSFTDFVLDIMYPPNPVRRLDDQDTPAQALARDIYMGPRKTDSFFNCNGCHTLDPAGNAEFGVAKPGFFGTDGKFSFESEPQIFKIAHLRNMYQKVGMFGMPATNFLLPFDTDHKGDQVRGFGFLHDGSIDTLFRFHTARVFIKRPAGTISPVDPGNPDGFTLDVTGVTEQRAMEQFMLAFPSNLKPIVGQQATLTAGNLSAVEERLNLMRARADAGDCQLVAKGGGRGYLYVGGGMFRTDRASEANLTEAELRARALEAGGELTFTCVPPGSGVRIGIDRDGDSTLDRDEQEGDGGDDN